VTREREKEVAYSATVCPTVGCAAAKNSLGVQDSPISYSKNILSSSVQIGKDLHSLH
jgi:hypothetical protein